MPPWQPAGQAITISDCPDTSASSMQDLKSINWPLKRPPSGWQSLLQNLTATPLTAVLPTQNTGMNATGAVACQAAL